MEINAKHVFVTGGAKRLGRALVEYFLKRGARVTAHVFRSPLDLKEKNLQTLSADLRKIDEIPSLVSEAEKHFGPVAVLVNSASVFYPTPTPNATQEQWEDIDRLNLQAPFFLSQACWPGLRSQKGCVLNLCDIHTRGLKRFAAYSASKGGLWTLTRTLAREWAPDVRVNSISPGTVLPPDDFTPQQKEHFAQKALLGRLGTPEDIVAAAAWLTGNDYVTGFDLVVDGGASLSSGV